MKKIIITGELSEETSDDELDTLFDLLPQIGITEIEFNVNPYEHPSREFEEQLFRNNVNRNIENFNANSYKGE